MLKKMEKSILEPDPDQSHNPVDCSLTRCLLLSEISWTFICNFLSNLYNVWKHYLSIILYTGQDLNQSQNLIIDSFLGIYP